MPKLDVRLCAYRGCRAVADTDRWFCEEHQSAIWATFDDVVMGRFRELVMSRDMEGLNRAYVYELANHPAVDHAKMGPGAFIWNDKARQLAKAQRYFRARQE